MSNATGFIILQNKETKMWICGELDGEQPTFFWWIRLEDGRIKMYEKSDWTQIANSKLARYLCT
jgi:hypothetical protein